MTFLCVINLCAALLQDWICDSGRRPLPTADGGGDARVRRLPEAPCLHVQAAEARQGRRHHHRAESREVALINCLSFTYRELEFPWRHGVEFSQLCMSVIE